jgi:hypothetical protein
MTFTVITGLLVLTVNSPYEILYSIWASSKADAKADGHGQN